MRVYDVDIMKHLKIINGLICYKGVPLWNAIETDLNSSDAWLDSGCEGEYYTIIYKDSCGNLYHFGQWDSLEGALEWLDNPTGEVV